MEVFIRKLGIDDICNITAPLPLLLKYTAYLALAAVMLVGLMATVGCKTGIEGAFRDKVPDIANECQAVLSIRQEAPTGDSYLSGPLLILAYYPEDTYYEDGLWRSLEFKSGVSIFGDAYDRTPYNAPKDAPENLPNEFLAREPNELRTVVWIIMRPNRIGTYVSGSGVRSPAYCVDMDVWLVDLVTDTVTGHKYLNGYPPPSSYTISSAGIAHLWDGDKGLGRAGWPAVDQLREWIINLPMMGRD